MTKQMAVFLILVLYIIINGIFIEPNALEVMKYDIEDNRLQGIRVAFLTDFHLKKRDYKRLDEIIAKTNSQKPDIVILGGDFAHGKKIKDTMNLEIMAEKLSLLTLGSKVYAVLGENDWNTDGEAITQALKAVDIRVLEDSNVRTIVKSRYIDIIGISDLTTRSATISEAFKRTVKPRIVITHNPDVYYDIIDDANIILAGHTHGGQFALPFGKALFASSRYGNKFASGLIKETYNTMIVSKGLGVKGIPIRINCKPEITIIDFKRARDQRSYY